MQTKGRVHGNANCSLLPLFATFLCAIILSPAKAQSWSANLDAPIFVIGTGAGAGGDGESSRGAAGSAAALSQPTQDQIDGIATDWLVRNILAAGQARRGKESTQFEGQINDLITRAFLAQARSNESESEKGGSSKSTGNENTKRQETIVELENELKLANLIRDHIKQEQQLLLAQTNAKSKHNEKHSNLLNLKQAEDQQKQQQQQQQQQLQMDERQMNERKRRMSQTPNQMQRTLMMSPDQLNAIQSLSLMDDYARVYKPKIISTARGFGK